MDAKVKGLLMRGAEEIRKLRREVELHEARQNGIETALLFLHATAAPRGGMAAGVDVAWEMDREAADRPEEEVPGGIWQSGDQAVVRGMATGWRVPGLGDEEARYRAEDSPQPRPSDTGPVRR